MCCVLGQDTLLSERLSPPKSINLSRRQNAGGNLQWTSISSRGAARDWDKFWQLWATRLVKKLPYLCCVVVLSRALSCYALLCFLSQGGHHCNKADMVGWLVSAVFHLSRGYDVRLTSSLYDLIVVYFRLLPWYITNSGFRICVKELFVKRFDPLTVYYAVLSGR